MTRKIAKPMTAQDRAVLRAAILFALKESGPSTLVALELALKFSEKRCYREILTLQETGEVVRHGEGKASRYGLKTVRWVDSAINARPRPASHQKGLSWWCGLSRDAMDEAIRKKIDWTSVTSHREGALSR